MERLTFSDAGPADWPYLLCLWWRNVRATHGFVAEDYLRAIGAALPGAYLPAMERVRLAWLEVAPAEDDGSDHAPGAGEGHFPTGTVAVPLWGACRRAFWAAWSNGWRCSSWSRACGAGASVRPCWRISVAAIPRSCWTSMNRTRRPGYFMPAGASRWWGVPRWMGRGSRIRSCICAGCGPGAPGQGKQPDAWPFNGLASLPSQQGAASCFCSAEDTAATWPLKKTETPGGTRRFGIVRENDNAVSLGKEISMRLPRGGRGGRSTAAPRRGPRRPGSDTCRHTLRRGS